MIKTASRGLRCPLDLVVVVREIKNDNQAIVSVRHGLHPRLDTSLALTPSGYSYFYSQVVNHKPILL